MQILPVIIAALAAVGIAAPTAPLAAQPAAPVEIARLTGPVSIDGVPNEPAWQAITPLAMTMYEPVFRGPPSQRTEIRVAYDDEAFYAAGRFYDTAPRDIRINSLYRDRYAGDDAFALYIDTFNDNQNFKWFGITPAAMRFDQLVSEDGAVINGNWDTHWAARTTVTDSGWFAEVRIPFSSLGFRTGADGRVVMGLTAVRLISRLAERVTYPAIDPRAEFRRPSQAQKVVLRDVRSPTPVYVTPYLLAGTSTESSLAPPPRDQTWRDAGLDVRYPLSGNLTADLTINTDFAQVEADDQQVNLDRFPLFFPERRRFFQEGSGLFDFALGGGVRLFHSRQIGLAEDRLPVPVIGGARLVGRAGAWDIGVLDMATRERLPTPAENFGVARLRRPVLNPYSTAGVLLTSRTGGGRHNVGLGGDAILRVRGDDYLTLRGATTIDDSLGGAGSLLDRSQLHAGLQRRTARGLAYTVDVTRAGTGFRPELGFQPRRDFVAANLLANRYVFTDSHPVFRRVWPGMLAFSTWRNADGVLESGQYAVWLQWETKGGGGGWIEPKLFHENVRTAFPIGRGATIPAGSYNFADLQLALMMGNGRRLRTSLDLRSGTYFDGTRTQVILNPTWNVSRHLELGADYQLSALRFASRDEAVNIHVARLRVRTALDARASGNAFVQFNSTTQRVDVNLRLRYAFSEGTDLWIVYNEGLDTDRDRDLVGVPHAWSMARTVIVKYSHTYAF